MKRLITYVFVHGGATFTATGRNAWAAKRKASALLHISPKALKLHK